MTEISFVSCFAVRTGNVDRCHFMGGSPALTNKPEYRETGEGPKGSTGQKTEKCRAAGTPAAVDNRIDALTIGGRIFERHVRHARNSPCEHQTASV